MEALLQRSERLDEEPPKAVRITHPWAAYNETQIHEGELFATLLHSLCDTVPHPPRNGRPRLPLSDMLYGMGLKAYSTRSTRRAMSGIRDAVASGRMCKEPSFTTPNPILTSFESLGWSSMVSLLKCGLPTEGAAAGSLPRPAPERNSRGQCIV